MTTRDALPLFLLIVAVFATGCVLGAWLRAATIRRGVREKVTMSPRKPRGPHPLLRDHPRALPAPASSSLPPAMAEAFSNSPNDTNVAEARSTGKPADPDMAAAARPAVQLEGQLRPVDSAVKHAHQPIATSQSLSPRKAVFENDHIALPAVDTQGTNPVARDPAAPDSSADIKAVKRGLDQNTLPQQHGETVTPPGLTVPLPSDASSVAESSLTKSMPAASALQKATPPSFAPPESSRLTSVQPVEQQTSPISSQHSPAIEPPATDNLKRIRGIGAALERRLHGLGYTRFAELAAWTSDDVRRIGAQLDFPGRIERERWVEQAREFAAETGASHS